MAGPLSRGAVVLVCAVLGFGCHDDDGDAARGAPAFEDVAWATASGATAQFAGGTVSGWTGCNRYTAPYEADGDALTIGAIAATQMACEPQAATIEREFLAALERVERWRVEGDELVLEPGLRMRTVSPEGSWVATMFLQGDGVSSPLPGTEVTATFADGVLTGSAGCNSYRASYTAENGAIEIAAPVATKKACSTGVMQQEQAYLTALPTAAQYTVEGETLSLLTAQGTYVAIYQDG